MFLMANLGSDISQVFMHLERKEELQAASVAGRVRRTIAELMVHSDLTGRTGEIEILRTVIDDALSEKRHLDVSRKELEDYFMPFSIRVLRQTL